MASSKKSTFRRTSVTVRTAKGRPIGSTRWLSRQLNDPYVEKARKEGYRSRAAYKLLEINEKLGLLKKGMHVIDLGAAPGGWTQIAVEAVNAKVKDGGKVVGLDLLAMEPIPHALLFQGDFQDDAVLEQITEAMEGKIDVILSDMAPSACGYASVDHLRIMTLCEEVFEWAFLHLKENGSVIVKIWRGGTERALLDTLKTSFTKIHHIKPPSSRSDSSEMYLIATGFKNKV